jgi:hypothetical protein
MEALTQAFARGQTIVLFDNFEDTLDPESARIRDAELDEALRALLQSPPHGLKILLTTRPVPHELVLVHPDHATDAGILAILGGPFVYLLGNMLFKWVTNTRRTAPLSHMAGLLLLLLLAIPAFMHLLSALALGLLTTAVLMVVATWEWIALHRK